MRKERWSWELGLYLWYKHVILFFLESIGKYILHLQPSPSTVWFKFHLTHSLWSGWTLDNLWIEGQTQNQTPLCWQFCQSDINLMEWFENLRIGCIRKKYKLTKEEISRGFERNPIILKREILIKQAESFHSVQQNTLDSQHVNLWVWHQGDYGELLVSWMMWHLYAFIPQVDIPGLNIPQVDFGGIPEAMW